MFRFIRIKDYTWWLWFVCAGVLLAGLLIDPRWFLVAIALAAVQAVWFVVRFRSVRAFAVQLRIAFLVFVAVCYWPPLRALYWVPAIGTLAMLFTGYCLMARLLSLLPWNRSAPLTGRRLFEIFFSPPRLDALIDGEPAAGCPGGVCSLEVQVGRRRPEPA